jgi:DNA repair exonuclease SbcCD ATPase subunit
VNDFTASVNQIQSDLAILSLSTKVYTREVYQQVSQTLAERKTAIDAMNQEINTLNVGLQHYQKHKDDGVTCPKCQEYFLPMLGDFNEVNAQALISQYITDRDQHIATLNDLEMEMMEIEEYLSLRKALSNLIKMNPLVLQWWQHFGFTMDKPKVVSTALLALLQAVNQEIDIRYHQAKLEGLETHLALYQSIDLSREAELRDQVNALDQRLDHFNQQLIEKTTSIDQYQQYGKALHRRLSEIETLTKVSDMFTQLELELQVSVMADFVDIHLEDLSHTRTVIFNQLQAARNNASHIKEIKAELVNLENSVKTHAALLRAINPTEGVIAEGMLGFIHFFTNEMNYHIRKLWIDPLTITPCLLGESGIELDYLFPVQTLNESPEDISVCSSGQKEMIDLAFREAGMRCLGLSSHPVLFDEWGVRMDETHKLKSCDLLGSFTDKTQHDQIIIVSHTESVHNALGDVRRLVLCDKNITIEGEYNTHVLIER